MSRIESFAAIVMFSLSCARNGDETPPVLDHAMFAERVQPVLAQRCANPSCHGNDRRALRVYATERFRLEPARLYLPEAISVEELARNESCAAAFAHGILAADDSLLLTKPLEGSTHLGGAIFAGPDDRDYLVIRAWLQSGGLR
jgi:hypothetical protein